MSNRISNSLPDEFQEDIGWRMLSGLALEYRQALAKSQEGLTDDFDLAAIKDWEFDVLERMEAANFDTLELLLLASNHSYGPGDLEELPEESPLDKVLLHLAWLAMTSVMAEYDEERQDEQSLDDTEGEGEALDHE